MIPTSRFVLALLLVACGEKKAPPGSTTSTGSAQKTAAQPPWLAHVELPVVDGFKTPARDEGDVVVVAPNGIVVGGTAVVALTDGRADPSEREASGAGLKIPRLTNYLAQYQVAKHPPPTLPLAIDKRVPYRTFVEVVFSAKQKEAGFKQFTLLAKSTHGTLAEAPFALPDRGAVSVAEPGDMIATGGRRRPGADLAKQIEDVRNAGSAVKVGEDKANDKELSSPKPKEKSAKKPPRDDSGETYAYADVLVGESEVAPADPDQPVKLVVAITKTEVILWSISGLEGTLTQPKLRVPLDGAAAPVRKALEDIVAHRWTGRERTEMSIIIMAEGDTPMQRVAEMVGAVRANTDGKPLFPDLTFSTGFE